ncbi:MAG: hypothetical protein JNG84_02465 [Archangium sp.]|nr:hypothetical protein [Archangium sp.]
MNADHPKRQLTPARRRRAPRGQAVTEYALISHVILLGGTISMIPVFMVIFENVSNYYRGFYFVLSTGAL